MEVNLATDRHPQTYTKRSQIVTAVTSVVFSLALLGTKLLGLPAQLIMIFFITKSSLVPLIEGECSLNSISIRVLGLTFTSFVLLLLCFFGRFFKKKQLVQISSRLPAYMYTYVLCTHLQIHVYQDLVHLNFSGPPSVSSRPLRSHRVPMCSVCVCVCIYTHTHTYTLTPVKNREDTSQHLYLSFC